MDWIRSTQREAERPWWEAPGPDLFAEAIPDKRVEIAWHLELEPATPELWEMSCRQYEAFAPGKYEWPALKRRCDRADPSYKN